MHKNVTFTRITRLMTARAKGMEEAIKVENEIAAELIRPSVLELDPASLRTAHGEWIDVTPFRSAEKLSCVLDAHLQHDKKGKYDPKFASERAITSLWELRQVIDQLSMPYDVYVDAAMSYVGKPNGRAPRLSQLMRRDVVAHVANEWVSKL